MLKRGIPAKKLSSILNSADPRLFPEAQRTEPSVEPASEKRPLILMYHGTLATRNGVDAAIHALVQAAKQLHIYVWILRDVEKLYPT